MAVPSVQVLVHGEYRPRVVTLKNATVFVRSEWSNCKNDLVIVTPKSSENFATDLTTFGVVKFTKSISHYMYMVSSELRYKYI